MRVEARTARGCLRVLVMAPLLVLYGGAVVADAPPVPLAVADGEADDDIPVDLTVRGAEVRDLLHLLGEQRRRNVVIHEEVGGRISLNLEQVPWHRAVTLILESHGLAMRDWGGVLFIAPEAILQERAQQRLRAAREREKQEPLYQVALPVHYASAEELVPLLDHAEGGLLSERAAVVVDPRTNQLLVRETREGIDALRGLLETLDVPARQVMIEARIVVARKGVNEELGARFGVSRHGERRRVSGSLAGIDAMAGDGGSEAVQRLAVDLPALDPAGQLAVSVLNGRTLLDMELSALQAEGRGETLSNPRVLTASQHEARIEQGVEIPYQQSAGDGATSVAFKRAVLRLDVRPRITPEEDVILELRVNKDSVGQVFNGVPSIDTRELRTRARIADGETVVLGGIFENEQNQRVSRVPLLGRIPLLGRLFRHTSASEQEHELLIFVTPRLLADGGGA